MVDFMVQAQHAKLRMRQAPLLSILDLTAPGPLLYRPNKNLKSSIGKSYLPWTHDMDIGQLLHRPNKKAKVKPGGGNVARHTSRGPGAVKVPNLNNPGLRQRRTCHCCLRRPYAGRLPRRLQLLPKVPSRTPHPDNLQI